MLLMPIIFFYRRLIFISSVILLRENIFTLILIQIGLVQGQLAVLHILRTFESKSALWKQTQDECTYFLLIYVLMCFTDFVPDPEQRSKLGIAYISIMLGNIGFHLIIVLGQTLKDLCLKLKRCFARRHLYMCLCFCKKRVRNYAIPKDKKKDVTV